MDPPIYLSQVPKKITQHETQWYYMNCDCWSVGLAATCPEPMDRSYLLLTAQVNRLTAHCRDYYCNNAFVGPTQDYHLPCTVSWPMIQLTPLHPPSFLVDLKHGRIAITTTIASCHFRKQDCEYLHLDYRSYGQLLRDRVLGPIYTLARLDVSICASFWHCLAIFI